MKLKPLFTPLILSVALTLMAAPALALDIGGQSVADHADVAGQSLQLNGAGVRKKVIFDVYVAALYTTAKTGDASAVINASTPRCVELHMLRGVAADTIHASFVEALQANVSEAQLATLKPRLVVLENIFNEVKTVRKGDVIRLDFIPGQGTHISVRGKAYAPIAGDDFAAAMLSIWLGLEPVQGNLKRTMLGATP